MCAHHDPFRFNILTWCRVRSWSSKRTFVEIPSRYNANATDLTLNSVICWSFYPKVLRREGKGWRNVANNQSVSLHPSSVNQGVEQTPQWLSFYHIMQSSNKCVSYDSEALTQTDRGRRFYNAHETSAVEPFALVLACGEADFKVGHWLVSMDGGFTDHKTARCTPESLSLMVTASSSR